MKLPIPTIIITGLITINCLAFGAEIHDAAKAGELEKVKALVAAKPDLVFSQDATETIGWNRTPLHWAAQNGRTNVVVFLLANKADVNAKASNGWTPLIMAVEKKQKGVVELLLSNKADVNAAGNTGDTALFYAAHRGNIDIVGLLIANGADVNAKLTPTGVTPLHEAVKFGHNDVAALLRKHGAHE